MVPASVRPFARVGALALAGVGVAFAWILLALVLGFGSSGAHASDDNAEGGLLGSVTGLVGDTVGTVTDTVSNVVNTADERVVQPVVETVTAVAPPVTPVVETVTETVSAVTEPVVETIDSGVVSDIVAPVVDVVASVPLVGDAAAGIGADKALTDVSDSVDNGLSALVDAVDHLVSTLPASPGAPGVVIPGVGPAAPFGTLLTSLLRGTATTPVAISAGGSPAFPTTGIAERAFVWTSAGASAPTTASPASEGSPSGDGGEFSHMQLPGLVTPTGGSISGPGGAGPGAAALLAFGPLVAYRAWVLRRGWEDDEVPAAPAGSTDVSPD